MPQKLSRSAATGKLVTAAKAKRSPKTTVTETVTGYQRNRKAVMQLLHAFAMTGHSGARLLIGKITGKKWSGYKPAQL